VFGPAARPPVGDEALTQCGRIARDDDPVVFSVGRHCDVHLAVA